MVAALLSCLLWADQREGQLLSLAELERGQNALMSCAHDHVPASSELLWCADADSPLCLPALPASRSIELGDAAMTVLLDSITVTTAAPVAVQIGWERPAPDVPPASRDRDRLERPPRA